jgi:hypothetical protein
MGIGLNKVIDYMAGTRQIPREQVIERLKQIIVSSWATFNKKEKLQPLKVDINEQNDEIDIYISKKIVSVAEDYSSQIGFQDALEIKNDAKLGDELRQKVPPALAGEILRKAVRQLLTGIVEEYPREKSLRRSLPRIPEIPKPYPEQTFNSPCFEENMNKTSHVEEPDPETKELLSILVNEQIEIDRQKKSVVPSTEELEAELNSRIILSEIEKALSGYDYLKIKKTLSEIHVEVSLSKRVFSTIFQVYDRSIVAKSLLPFALGAAVELMELSVQGDFTSKIGRISQGGNSFYIVKSKYSIRGLSKDNLWDTVCQPILEAFKAMKLIEKCL